MLMDMSIKAGFMLLFAAGVSENGQALAKAVKHWTAFCTNSALSAAFIAFCVNFGCRKPRRIERLLVIWN